MARQVNQLEKIRYVAHGSGAEQLRSEVALLERAMGHCAQVLVAIAKLDIDSRLAAISEAQADAVVRCINAALAAAGITGEAADAARRVAARGRTVDHDCPLRGGGERGVRLHRRPVALTGRHTEAGAPRLGPPRPGRLARRAFVARG